MSSINTRIIVHLLHVFIIGSLFLYVGLKRNVIPKWLSFALVGLGVIIGFYHIYKAYLRIAQNAMPWVSFIHIFGVAPLLVFIGYKQDTTPRYMYELLLLFGFASIGYHGLYLVEYSGIMGHVDK